MLQALGSGTYVVDILYGQQQLYIYQLYSMIQVMIVFTMQWHNLSKGQWFLDDLFAVRSLSFSFTLFSLAQTYTQAHAHGNSFDNTE